MRFFRLEQGAKDVKMTPEKGGPPVLMPVEEAEKIAFPQGRRKWKGLFGNEQVWAF